MCRGFVEFHLETTDPLVLGFLRLLGVRIVVTTSDVADVPSDLLVFKKYVISNSKKMRLVEKVWQKYDVVSFFVWRRDKVNEILRNELVQVITVDPLVDTPSKDQLRSAVKQGKYVEVVVGRGLRRSPHILAEFLKVLERVADEFIISTGVARLSDVKSPLDIASALRLLTGSSKYLELVKRQCEILVDLLFQRGVCEVPPVSP